MSKYFLWQLLVAVAAVLLIGALVFGATTASRSQAASAAQSGLTAFTDGIQVSGRGPIRAFTFVPKATATTYPVAVITPLDSSHRMALDITPGRLASGKGHGFAWIDVCEPNDGSLNCARIAARENDMQIGSRLFGGAVAKPLVFTVGSDTEVMRLTTDFNVGVGTRTPTVKLDVNGPMRAQQSTQPLCTAEIAGAIYFDSTASHFYGCTGTAWKRLDD